MSETQQKATTRGLPREAFLLKRSGIGSRDFRKTRFSCKSSGVSYTDALLNFHSITGRYLSRSQSDKGKRALIKAHSMKKKFRTKLAKQTQAVWEAVACATALLTTELPIHSLSHLYQWISISSLNAGISLPCKVLKKFCDVCRYRAALRDTDKIVVDEMGPPPTLHERTPKCLKQFLRSLKGRWYDLLQISSIARALPPGDEIVANEALSKHKDRLTSAVPLNRGIQDEIHTFSRKWSKKYRVDITATSMRSSTSGCMETPRARGGCNTALRNMVDTWMEEPTDFTELPFPFHDPSRFTDTGNDNHRHACEYAGWSKRGSVEYVVNLMIDPDEERLRICKILRDSALRTMIQNRGGIPRATVEVVAERGYKSRIVTKSPAWLVICGHLVRGFVWPMLARDPRVKGSILGDRLTSFFAELKEDQVNCPVSLGPLVLMSADLTAATDGFADWALRSCWDGICDGADFPQFVREVGHTLLGPMVLTWPDGHEEVTKRGALMGLPLSWCILCVLNLWALESSAVEECIEKGVSKSVLRQCCRAAVCGDDNASLTPLGVNRRYKVRMEAIGSGLSPGKHLLSQSLLLFTEQMAVFKREEQMAPAFTLAGKLGWTVEILVADKMVEYMPVKSLVNPGYFDKARSTFSPVVEDPNWVTAGPAISGAIPEYIGPDMRRKIAKLALKFRPESKLLELAGIPLHLPREFGGGGFPPIRPGKVFRTVPPLWRRAVFSSLIHADAGQARSIRNSWLVNGVSGDLFSDALEIGHEDFVGMQNRILALPDGERACDLAATKDAVPLSEDELVVRLATVWMPSLTIAGYQGIGRTHCRKFWEFRKILLKKVRAAGARITGRGQFLLGHREEDLIKSYDVLLEGPGYIVDRTMIPAGLEVIVGNKLARARDVRSSKRVEETNTYAWLDRHVQGH